MVTETTIMINIFLNTQIEMKEIVILLIIFFIGLNKYKILNKKDMPLSLLLNFPKIKKEVDNVEGLQKIL